MSEKKLLFGLLLFGFYASAQIKGVVKDSLSGEPIPYVNIWVENETIGTTSEENGSFSLDIKEEKVLVFSALGYESKKSSSKNEIILLKPKVFELKEVVISRAIKNKTIKLNGFKKEKISVYYGTGTQPTIIAKKIEPSEQINKHPFLKEINFLSRSHIEKAKIILRFYEVDPEGKPGIDFLDTNIVLEIKKGKKNNRVNLEKYKIRIPEDGLFIAFEWMIIEENKYTYTYTLEEEKNKISYKDGISYQPVIGTIPAENQSSWHYAKGKWYKRGKFSNVDKLTAYQNKFGELAIELILTN
jgi:hypothetical protein